MPETTQIDGGVHFRGGRSSAKCGCGAAAHRWVNGGARQHLKGGMSMSELLCEAEVLEIGRAHV